MKNDNELDPLSEKEIQESEVELQHVKDACSALGEHFDSVHIFATSYKGGDKGTLHFQWGAGNWFSRFGQIRTWVLKQEEAERVRMREEMEQDEEEL